MGYATFRREILRMINNGLLERSTSVAIARKGLGLLPTQLDTAAEGAPVDPWGTHAQVDQGGGTHSQFGSVYEHEAETLFEFRPSSATGMRRYADWVGISEVMILATVSAQGNAGSSFSLTIEYDADPTFGVGAEDVPFVSGGSPTVPLDTEGVHLSDWKAIDWPSSSTVSGERPALLKWWVENPSGAAGSIGLGLCQLFVRG